MDGLDINSTTNIGEDERLLNDEILDEAEEETPDETEIPTPKKAKTIVPTEETDEEADQDDEDEEGEGEPDEDETRGYHARPTIAQIKEKFPELFKTFPELKDVYFREQRYTSLFPTVEDAETANENSTAFLSLQENVMAGNSENLFRAVNDEDPKALVKLGKSILPTLYRLSPEAHQQATLPLLENLVRSFYRDSTDENGQHSALWLSKYLFGNFDVAKGTKTLQEIPDTKVTAERAELDRERQELQREKYDRFHGDVLVEASEGLGKIIGGDVKIDPDKVFTPFMRLQIRKEIVATVDQQLGKDKTHVAYMDSLWEKARKNGYKGDWKSRITDAYLARAKSLVPAVRSRLVAVAMGTTQSRDEDRAGVVKKIAGRREPGNSGRPSNGAPTTYDPRKVDWSKTSDADFLSDKVVLKR